MTRRVVSISFLLAILVATTASLSLASSIPPDGVRIAADCEGYTLYIPVQFIEPGETLEVEYRVTLDALTEGADDVVAEGTVVVDATGCVPDPGRVSCDFTTVESFTWNEVLGYALPCGDYRLNTSTDGSCEGKPSRYIWNTIDEPPRTVCERIFEGEGWDGFLECPCDEPGVEICRSPGFWGTHAGEEKKRSQNIAQQVIDAALMPIEVCGEPIDTTILHDSGSALEAICVTPRGNRRLQLARQLTAAALNCVMTNGNGDCFGVSAENTFASCNEACRFEDEDEYGHCIDAMDCFNNGGRLLDNGMCQTGTCASDGSPCDGDDACGLDDAGRPVECLPLEDNCHSQPLFNADLGLDFDPPGPAGSPKACNDAKKNDCTLFDCDGNGGKGHGKNHDKGRGGKDDDCGHGRGGRDR